MRYQVKFDDKGLVGAIVQDANTGDVLMFAWMNRESLTKSLAEGRACYWSRSRNKLWLKGETSGNFQTIQKVRLDCDGDCLLLEVALLFLWVEFFNVGAVTVWKFADLALRVVRCSSVSTAAHK